MQRAIVEIGLELLESARRPRTTVQTPFVWSADSSWRENYMRVSQDNLEELRRLGAMRMEARERAKAAGRLRGWTGSEIYSPGAKREG
jgi:hypothetical protein